jgi:hypothetical protein
MTTFSGFLGTSDRTRGQRNKPENFDDLLGFMPANDADLAEMPPYFLGSNVTLGLTLNPNATQIRADAGEALLCPIILQEWPRFAPRKGRGVASEAI